MMMREKYISQEIKEIYKGQKALQQKSIIQQKGLFHLHTPQSHDYRLFNGIENWQEVSEETIFQKCKEIDDFFALSFNTIEDARLLMDNTIFDSFKECLSFYCLALCIIKNDFKYIVVSDHNTIDGNKKLEQAINECLSYRTPKFNIEVIHGIEISCADKIHVVVIYDKKNITAERKMKEWLEANMISQQIGSFRPSLDVIEYFRSSELFLPYIAHINTADIFKDSFLTKAYKQKLFLLNDICIFGVNDITKQEMIIKEINAIVPDRECVCFLDNDAHSIDELSQNITYIKGERVDYHGIKKALIDYDVSFSFLSSIIPNVYIQSIIIPDNDRAFLHSFPGKGSNNHYFILNFSPEMNCIIGGRGAGKSTIINIISLLLGGNVSHRGAIEFICRHPIIYVFIVANGIEYVAVFSHPNPDYPDETYIDFLEKQMHQIHYKIGNYSTNRIVEFLQDKYIDIYQITNDNNSSWLKLNKSEKIDLLPSVFNNSYSINAILGLIETGNISSFITTLLYKDPQIKRIMNQKISDRGKALKPYFHYIKTKLQEKQNKITELLNKYELSHSKTVRISLIRTHSSQNYADILFSMNIFGKKQKYKGFEITNEDLYNYIYQIIDDFGIMYVLDAIINNNANAFLSHAELQNNRKGLQDKDINIDTQTNILNNLFSDLVYSRNEIISCLETYFQDSFSFALEFNISSNNANETAPAIYKPIENLSMGQKVVAILSFILSYGQYINDCTPLVIDQPEDNLDNQYIYSNLVNDLRSIRNQRQVIIATHNATLVTNCKAEKISVMQSDNQYAWVEAFGYSSNNRIAKKILQYLEGGKKSFKHRYYVYKDHL